MIRKTLNQWINTNTMRRSLAFLNYIKRRYIADGCANSAAALTYLSLFALVPLFTVMYSVLSIVPAFQTVGQTLEELIFNHFVPTSGNEVRTYLQQFSQQTRQLSGIGIAFLFVTALLMLKHIEKTFNAIWRTRSNRNKLSGFLLYWAILSLGPLCIGLAFAINAYLRSLDGFFDPTGYLTTTPLFLYVAPLLLNTIAFALLFAAVPNCRVPIRHALIGALITALVFETARKLFTTLVAQSSYQVIYGAFAAVPLFLLWIYLSWLIVLAGAEIVYALGNYTSHRRCLPIVNPVSPNIVFYLAVLDYLWQNYQDGKMLSEQDVLKKAWLFGRYNMSIDQWAPLRNKLLGVGLLQIFNPGHLVLARDLHHYSLWDLTNDLQLATQPFPAAIDQPPHWFDRSQQILTMLQINTQQTMDIALADLFADEDTAT